MCEELLNEDPSVSTQKEYCVKQVPVRRLEHPKMLNGGRLFRKKVAIVLIAVVCLPFTLLLLQRDESWLT